MTIASPIAGPCLTGRFRFRPRPLHRLAASFLFALLLVLVPAALQTAVGQENFSGRISLDGVWQVRLEGETDSSGIPVPGTLENGLQREWDGISHWSRVVEPVRIDEGQRLVLRFGAVATHARVWFQDQYVGEHLGGWTPFSFDLTDLASQHAAAREWTLRVEVDERVGHNTQGFLPVVTSHFSGIWQPVAFELQGPVGIARDEMLVRGVVDPKSGEPHRLEMAIPLRGLPAPESELAVAVAVRPCPSRIDAPNSIETPDKAAWQAVGVLRTSPQGQDLPRRNANQPARAENTGRMQQESPAEHQTAEHQTAESVEASTGLADPVVFAGSLIVPGVESWSPAAPARYEVQLILRDMASGAVLDEARIVTGFASFATAGRRLLMNGQPLQIRGVLNWGYAPPGIAPSLDEELMRQEIRFARERGFNLIKFCLWIPPPRYLELCDEAGMLAWIEYPTWHPRLDGAHRAELQREYREFFARDRNHPCVALRSLTCETGPSAELAVIRGLYDLGKAMIPGALIVDDSSWIEWNRVHDFYDDHPYGNNHTWRSSLGRLNAFIDEREPQPLILGEAIAADTFQADNPWEAAGEFLQTAHAPWAAAANGLWRERLEAIGKSWNVTPDPECWTAGSLRYAMEMRKFQIEAFRQEVPDGGYVVSVLRDFPKASMGLIDYRGKPKSTPADWAFHGDTMLLMKTAADRRAFRAGEPFELEWILAGGPTELPAGFSLRWQLESAGQGAVSLIEEHSGSLAADQFRRDPDSGLWRARQSLQLPAAGEVPVPLVLKAETEGLSNKRTNTWTLWSIPRPTKPATVLAASDDLFQSLQSAWPGDLVRADGEGDTESDNEGGNEGDTESRTTAEVIRIGRRLDRASWSHLMAGGKMVLLPDGGPGSLPVTDHWFLRGGPVVLGPGEWNTDHPTAGAVPPAGAADRRWQATASLIGHLQHFDLAGPVIPGVDSWLENAVPRTVLWDSHDQRECRTHGLWLEIPVGERGGWLAVSAFAHTGPGNVAGEWVLTEVVRSLAAANSATPRNQELAQRNAVVLLANLERKEFDLVARSWSFRPDPENRGHEQQWFLQSGTAAEPPGHPQEDASDSWQPIKVASHWDSQGHGPLDGWGWYRCEFQVPADWPADRGWLVLDGVDDCCEIWLDDQRVGKCGDPVTRESAFEVQSAVDLQGKLRPGATVRLTIAVFDWQGAGGLFRPLRLSTEDPRQSLQMALPRAE